MGSGVSKSQQAKANRELEAQLKSLQSEVTRLKISSTSILKDNDFGVQFDYLYVNLSCSTRIDFFFFFFSWDIVIC